MCIIQRIRIIGWAGNLYKQNGDSDFGLKSLRRNAEHDYTQESVLGPLMWNIVCDTLLRELMIECDPLAYTDDVMMLVMGNTRAQVEE